MKEVQVELISINDVTPYDKNTKIHTPEQVSKIAGSIKKFGWQGNPIIVDKEGVIVAGHGRRLAAIELGLKKVPVVVMDAEPGEVKALRIADNRVALGEFDFENLKDEILELAEFDIDMTDLGFDEGEINFDMELGDISSLIGDIDNQDAQENTVKPEPRRVENVGEYKSALMLYVEDLKSEEAQEELYQELTERGYKVKVLSV